MVKLQLTAVCNHDPLGAFARLRSIGFNLLDDLHALYDLSKDDMLSIKPRSLGSTNEKLGTVGIGSSIGHAEDTGASVLELEVLVLELVAVDGLAAGPVVVGEVPPLAHEVGDDSVESRATVPKAFLSSAKGSEILSGLGNHVSPQLHDNSTDRHTTRSDVEIYTWTSHFECGFRGYSWI